MFHGLPRRVPLRLSGGLACLSSFLRKISEIGLPRPIPIVPHLGPLVSGVRGRSGKNAGSKRIGNKSQ